MSLLKQIRDGAGSPGRSLRYGFSLLGWEPGRVYMPVAGIDEGRASHILFTLRQTANTPKARQAAIDLLIALQVAQIASDRLVANMDYVGENLQFWETRMQRGQHLLFLLFSTGPLAFLQEAEHRLFRQARVTASDQIEQRVVVLRGLQGRLAEQLALLHSAAGRLLLHPDSRGGTEGSENGGTIGSTAAGPAFGRPAEAPKNWAAGEGALGQDLAAAGQELISSAGDAATQTLATVRQVCLEVTAAVDEMLQPEAPEPAEEGGGLAHMADVLREVAVRHTLHTFPGARGNRSEGVTSPSRATDERPAEEGGMRAAALSAAEDAQSALGVCLATGEATTVHAALQAVTAEPLAGHPTIRLPAWLAAPSHYQQHWLRYTAAALLAAWSLRWLYRHSWLAGSDDLEVWARSAVEAGVGAYREHILSPLMMLRDELFNTFRARRSIVSVEEFETDRDSLMRMLADFQTDNASNVAASAAVPEGDFGEDGPERGMLTLMAVYENELKKPIRNLVNGQLARSLLIQVQKLKVDTESAMLEMDQILRANELSLSLVAATPAVLALGAALLALWRWLTPRPPDPRWEAAPCRLAMVEVERALGRVGEGGDLQAQGLAVYRVVQAYHRAASLFRKHPGLAAHSEWPAMRADLLDLAGTLPVPAKRRICKRMMRAYSVLQP